MYLKDALRKEIPVPQTEPLPGRGQVPNEAGGYVWQVDDWQRLLRFLILGSEGGTYYASQKELTLQNAECVRQLLKQNGLRVVEVITEVSQAGRAPKNDPALFALAICMAEGDVLTRRAATAALPKVARIGTHLYHFVAYLRAMRGWGRIARKAVRDWFLEQDADRLAYQMVKYAQRDGWSGRDLLRLTHAKPQNQQQNAVFKWAVRKELVPDAPVMIRHAAAIEINPSEAVILKAVQDGFPWEAIPSNRRTDAVWKALLPKLGMTAMIRSLGNLSARGVIDRGAEDGIVRRLLSLDALRVARVHPIQLLAALMTYQQGHGMRGSGEWKVNQLIARALEGAFYLSFGLITPTGKRLVLALDVSGSMQSGELAGVPGLTPHLGTGALAMLAVRSERQAQIIAFADTMREVYLGADERLDSVLNKLRAIPFGGTDCALPMIWAMQNKVLADAFIIYTDNETWAGEIHPAQALQAYREQTGIPAKLVVVGMTSNGFTIADPQDAGMMDVVGFDTATPQVIADFISDGQAQLMIRSESED